MSRPSVAAPRVSFCSTWSAGSRGGYETLSSPRDSEKFFHLIPALRPPRRPPCWAVMHAPAALCFLTVCSTDAATEFCNSLSRPRLTQILSHGG